VWAARPPLATQFRRSAIALQLKRSSTSFVSMGQTAQIQLIQWRCGAMAVANEMLSMSFARYSENDS
jgi:hypothetical protein